MTRRIKIFTLAFIFLCSAMGVNAQKTVFTINPGEKIESVVPDSVRYLYPTFKNGIVYFKDGRLVNARLNYNSLFEEIMFIAPGGDTMALDNGATMKYVVVETDTFYFDNFFLRSSGTYGDIKLASKELFAIMDVNSIGAMGNNAPSAVTTVRTFLTRGQSRELTRQEVLKIRKQTQFYIGDRFNHYKIVNRKNLMDFFPGKSKKVKEYLKDNTVNFSSKDDLDKLIVFLQTAQAQ
jgi:hypothetical protein